MISTIAFTQDPLALNANDLLLVARNDPSLTATLNFTKVLGTIFLTYFAPTFFSYGHRVCATGQPFDKEP